MKYLKTFEDNTTYDIEIHEYVICTDTIIYHDDGHYNEYINFLKTNMGKYLGRNRSEIYNYSILYKGVPENIIPYFVEDAFINKNYPSDYQLFRADRNDILYHSKNKEDLMAYINSNKFNL